MVRRRMRRRKRRRRRRMMRKRRGRRSRRMRRSPLRALYLPRPPPGRPAQCHTPLSLS